MHGYEKVREVGSGSFGKAILVKSPDRSLLVMKTIDISQMDAKEKRDAINEVKVLSSLKHPYIVSYRKSFVEGGKLCIIMDYAEGGDLFSKIAKARKLNQPFGEPQCLRWFTQATLALKYMHDKHILHRDLKSQNLFLTSSGRLRIGDFGISKVLECTVAFAKTTIGTPYYLSPEICQERPYSWSSDIWALGCILHEIAHLRVPFDASNLRCLVEKITRGPTPQLPLGFSAELRQLGAELLQRDYRRRPSAADILQKPIIQAEIRRMLQEEQAKRPENDAKIERVHRPHVERPSENTEQPPEPRNLSPGRAPKVARGARSPPRRASPTRRPSEAHMPRHVRAFPELL